MAGRARAMAMVVSVLGLLHGVGPSTASGPNVEFQDGAGNTAASLGPYDTAAFYISDAGLGVIETSTATWTEISASVPALTTWSLATGGPDSAAFVLSAGSGYDTTTPAGTPLHSAPTVYVDASPDPALLYDCDAITGEFSLVFGVAASSTLQVDFSFYVLDSYPAAQHRVRVTSTSDTAGEWAPISAVVSVSGTGVCPVPGLYPPPGLFSGQVFLSESAAAAGEGDGFVRVRPGDALTATYYDSDGVTALGAHQVDVTAPGPTAVPAATWLSLVLLGVAFTLAVAGVSRRRPALSAAGIDAPVP